jgi:hypothetical protein
VVSWRFFSARADSISSNGIFPATAKDSNAEEAATLFGILEDMGKEAYMAVYDQLGANGLPHPGAGLFGGLSGGGPDLGQHQQGAGRSAPTS